MNMQAIHQESDDKKNEYASNPPRIILKQEWISKQYTRIILKQEWICKQYTKNHLETRMNMQAIHQESEDKKNEYASNIQRIRW